jgi:beta-1,4-N-acetylglucosaminyltransferase
MILVTVGSTRPFDRLVRAADELASLVDERITIQRGAGSYQPGVARHVRFVDGGQMQKWLSEARVVISHAGAGSILGALRAGKPLVLAPRMCRLGEHMDDHQFELAEALMERGQAMMVTHLSAVTLAEAIAAAERQEREMGVTGLHAALRDWLAEQAAEPPPRRWRTFRRNRR